MRPIQPVVINHSATRVLRVLEALNAEHPAGTRAIARHLSLSVATTYRLLETLVAAGYAYKNPDSARYSPAQQVLALSCGFDEEQWVAEAARPILRRLGRELCWPLAIATPSGPGMLIRESTDRDSPLAVTRFAPGRRIRLVGTASGTVYLAYCRASHRELLMDMAIGMGSTENRPMSERARLRATFAVVKRRGYAVQRGPQKVTPMIAIAVPIMTTDTVLGSLCIRYAEKALEQSVALQRFLSPLRDAARVIGHTYIRLASAGNARSRTKS